MPDRAPSFPEHTPTTGELIKAAAAARGDKVLAVLGDDRLTYAEAEAQSAALAKGLLASGAGKGTRVGLLAGNSPEWIVGWLGITRMGGVAVLLNTYGKARELGWVLRHADIQVLLTVDAHLGHDYLERLEQAIPGLADQAHERILVESHPYLRSVWTWGDGRRPWAAPVADLVARSAGDHRRAAARVRGRGRPRPTRWRSCTPPAARPTRRGRSTPTAPPCATPTTSGRCATSIEDDVLYTPMPLFWVGGFSFTLIAAMHAGATLVFEEQFEPGATLDLIERERVTQVLGWPHMAKALVDHPSFKDRDLSSIRGGSYAALLPPDQQADAEVPKANSLGMTETLGPHTFDSKDNPLPPEKDGSFGFSVPGVEHKIVDPVTLEDVPVGETGEVWLRGYSLMLGLHKRERADVFTPDGWYRTGDGGHFDEDGHFYFTGRMGDLIKSAGMNITPRDVELVLEAMPEVALAFVAGIPAGERGRGRGRRHRPAARRDPRRGRGEEAGEGGDRQLQGAPPRRRVRRPDRAPVARLRQDRSAEAHRHPRRALRVTHEGVRPVQRGVLRGPLGHVPVAARRGARVPQRAARLLGGVALRRLRRGAPRRRHLHVHARAVNLAQLPQRGLRRDGRPASASMIMMDPPMHERMRKLVNRAFTPRRIAEWEPVVQRVIGGLLDALAGRDALRRRRRLRRAVPGRGDLQIVGVPDGDRQQIRHWTDRMLELEVGNPFPDRRGHRGRHRPAATTCSRSSPTSGATRPTT